MANARPPGGGTPQARIGLDLSSMQNAAAVARAAGQATAREINAMFQAVRTSQQLALQEARQATSTITAQNAQATANARAQSQERIQQARAESIAQQQQARASAAAVIEEERRKTAAYKAEIRERQQAAHQPAFGQSAATFAGAALGGPLGGIAGALAGGAPALGVGLVVGQAARFAQETAQLATAYERQRVAAENLAGSQVRLNQLLAVYDRATGGAIDNAQALADVTKLMSVGFADNAQELDQFARAIRGISIAMGTSQDTVTQNLILELFSQRGQRLDQLGLQYDKVRQRADELRAADASLTQQQAYQNAVLEQANERFGKLADTTAGAATGAEKAAKEWKNLRLELGQDLKANAVDDANNAFAELLKRIREARRELRQWSQELESRRLSAPNASVLQLLLNPALSSPTLASRTSIGRVTPQAFGAGGAASQAIDAEQRQQQQTLITQRWMGLNAITRNAQSQIADVTRQTSEQRASIIRQYETSTAREAEDFARKRLNDERRFNLSLLDIAQDSARQRVKWEQDTARALAEAQAETAERIAELRADSAEKVAEIEEDFAKDQEKRARDHGKRLREAAANLDAVAVREEQRRYREENQEAKEAHEERIADAEKSLQKAIDDQNKALAKQELQQRESLQRRIDEQAENDRLRIEEMKANFEEQKAQEDIERGIRLERQRQDHDNQLVELDRQAGARLEQIRIQAQAERDQLEEEFKTAMVEAGGRLKAWEDYLKQRENAANASFDRVYGHMIERWNSLGNIPTGHPSLADPYASLPLPSAAPVTNSTRSNTVNIAPNAINVVAPPNMALDERTASWFMGLLADFFEDYPQ